MKLYLVCCDRHMDGFVNVDIVHPADQIVDLAGPWPWPDSSIDEVVALDVCEHIAGYLHIHADGYARTLDGRIHFMNELRRVLKPGGRATIETPNAAHGVGYFQDPTHVSPWCMSTFKYFEHGAYAHTRLAKAYGITAVFKILEMKEIPSAAEGYGEMVYKIHAVLEAVK